ncbi:MAG: electron transfer flavoprotein subunit alpha/FixB family protein [Thermodesulfobacteriota bacterium]|nr:electron transfer flavoprotein subunit alpha/FixB family protein [Thermodesulfobacteriota bacterium]
MGEILILAEHRDSEIRDITFEMLTLANRLGEENNLTVTALFPGYGVSALAGSLKGACDRVLVMEAPELENYNADTYLAVLEGLIRERKPALTVIGHTAQGMDLAPALAIRSGVPLVTDCVDVILKGETMDVQRQIYSGKIQADLVMKPSETYLITLRPGCFPGGSEQGKSADMESLSPPEWTGLRRQFVEYLEAELEDVDITAADILVSVGRGIGKMENIPVVEAFANAIGATLSCSRPVADKEWLPKSRQVGTSGKTVKPKVYIALGISGAFQHQAGMKNADTVIAVNTDPKAPIFNVAHYGIVGEILQVVPELTERFKKE